MEHAVQERRPSLSPLTLTPEIAVVREARGNIFLLNQNLLTNRFSATSQGLLQDWTILNEQTIERLGRPIMLCDRSVLDAAIYADFGGDTSGADQLFRKVEPFIGTYEQLWLSRPCSRFHMYKTQSEPKMRLLGS